MTEPPSYDRGPEAQKNIESHDSIIAHSPAPTQYLKPRSPHSSPRISPQLANPTHVDQVTLQTWTRENSLKLDRWLWYIQKEFELLGGAR